MLMNISIIILKHICDMALIDLKKVNASATNKLTEFVYANINVHNDDDDNDIFAKYSTTQDLPLIGNQQDFQLRVVRFKIPMSNVPLFLWEPDDFAIGIGRMPLGSTEYDDEAIEGLLSTPILYPSNAGRGSGPNTPTEYSRAVYDIQTFLNYVNFALYNLYNEFLGRTDPVDQFNAPYFKLDPCCNIFQLVMPLDNALNPQEVNLDYDINGTSSPFYPNQLDGGLKMLMSPKLYELFNGFPAYRRREAIQAGPFGIPLLYMLLIEPPEEKTTIRSKDDGVVPPEPVGNIFRTRNPATNAPDLLVQTSAYWQCQVQNTSSVYAWQQANKLLITSSMSVVREAQLEAEDDLQESGRPLRLELLADFNIEQTNDAGYKEFVYYNDQGQNRYMNIKDEGALRRIDMQVFIQFSKPVSTGTNGERRRIPFPLTIRPGSEFGLKLGFKRKDHNDRFQISERDERHTKGP